MRTLPRQPGRVVAASQESEPLLAKVPGEFLTLASMRAFGIEVPPAFVCPLSDEIMKVPVIAECGNSFERDAFTAHVKRNGFVSPHEGLQEYLSEKAPVNRSLMLAIKRWSEIVRETGAAGSPGAWLPYKSPRWGQPFEQPVVMSSDGSTLEWGQVDVLLRGNTLSPFPPKGPMRQHETFIPNLNLRHLMQYAGKGATLQPAMRATKLRIHDGEPLHAWDTQRQAEAGCWGCVLGAGCGYFTALPLLLCFGGLAPHAAITAGAWGLGAAIPGMLGSCISRYREASAGQQERAGFRKRRWRSEFAHDPRYAADTSAPRATHPPVVLEMPRARPVDANAAPEETAHGLQQRHRSD